LTSNDALGILLPLLSFDTKGEKSRRYCKKKGKDNMRKSSNDEKYSDFTGKFRCATNVSPLVI
jgi:hypothetical protein